MIQTPLDELAQYLVHEKLNGGGAQAAAAAQVAKKLLLASVPRASIKDPASRDAVRRTCRGAALGLLIHARHLGEGVVTLLHAVAEAAFDLGLDPTETLTHALEGLADVRRLLLPDQVESLRAAVASEFLGAGPVLDSLLEQNKS